MADRAWVLLKSGQRLGLLNPDPYGWTDEGELGRVKDWCCTTAVRP